MIPALPYLGIRMSKAIIANSLGDRIARENPDFNTILNQLWRVSFPLHNDQNEGNGTENGGKHAEKVVENTWRLITEAPRTSTEDFEISELFILSAGGCCHDFGKALRKYKSGNFPPNFKHGAGSGDFVKKNRSVLGFVGKETLADWVSELCTIHDLKGKDFKAKMEELGVQSPTNGVPINIHRLAVLLKASDILHTDRSRINTVGIDPLRDLSGIELSKYLARRCILGWRTNGDTIIVESDPEDDQQEKAVDACRDYMVNFEWPDVKNFLKPHGFAYKLQFIIHTEKKGVMTMPDIPKKLIAVKRDRKFSLEVAKSALYSVVKSFRDGELCPNEYVLHAAGTAVASLATQTMLERISYMIGELDRRTIDMLGETDHSVRKLKEHIKFLISIRSTLKQLIDKSAVELEGINNVTMGMNQRENALNRIFRVLPKGSEVLDHDLPDILDKFRQQIDKLEDLLLKISDRIYKLPFQKRDLARSDPRRYEKSIRPVLQKVASELNKIKKKVKPVLQKVATMKMRLDDDWTNDFFDIKRPEQCNTE